MLRVFGNQCNLPMPSNAIKEESSTHSRFQRNEKEDLKTGIDLLYKFKEDLDKLHPQTIEVIEAMLQKQRY